MIENTNNITHSHDKLFKTVFSKKEAVAEFVQKLLPSYIADRIDLDSLTLDSTEYVDEHLKTHCSDVVYNADYISDDQQKTAIKISLLFEHKSYQVSRPHLQLLRYLVNAWDMQTKQKQDLTPIIPVIFYHGQRAWQYKAFTDYFEHLDANLLQFLPSFDYALFDTTQYDNKSLQQLDVEELQYSIFMMKYIANIDRLLANAHDIFTNIEPFTNTEDGGKFFQTMVIYLYQHSKLTAEEWREIMHAISPQLEEKFISTYDQAINEGMLKGMQKGIAKGRQEGKLEAIRETAKNLKKMGIDINVISKSTGLSIEIIQKLK